VAPCSRTASPNRLPRVLGLLSVGCPGCQKRPDRMPLQSEIVMATAPASVDPTELPVFEVHVLGGHRAKRSAATMKNAAKICVNVLLMLLSNRGRQPRRSVVERSVTSFDCRKSRQGRRHKLSDTHAAFDHDDVG